LAVFFPSLENGQPLSFVPSVLLIALLAPLVSYRRRDGLFLLVPVWNLVVVWRTGARCDWAAVNSRG
jgi:hypothetical protein